MENELTSKDLHEVQFEDRWTSVDRIASLIVGGTLVVLGWRRRSPANIGAMVSGGILIYWGVTGDSRLCRIIGYKGPHTRSGVASVHHNRAVRIEKAVTVKGPVDDIYRVWRNPESMPCFVDHLKSVRAVTDSRSHWVVRGPAGSEIEWESEIYNEKKNESFAWHSLLNADVNNAGSVHFRSIPGSDQTEVRVVLSYEPPGGTLGSRIAKLLGADPEMQLEMDLLNFKQFFEAGMLHVQ